MKEKFNIIAIYKEENYAKVIFEQQNSFFEVYLECHEFYDKVCINGKCLSEERDISLTEFKSLLIAGTETLKELFKSLNRSLKAKVKNISDKNIDFYEYFMDFEAQSLGYSNVMIVPYVDCIENPESEMHVLTEKTIQETDRMEFLKIYETEYLRNHRFYQKQRKNYMPWDEYFMAVAKLTSLRSKDPSTQVGACIVGEDNRILSIGYNGAPIGIKDDFFPWERTGENLHTKYMYVCHAEMNAILNYRGSRKDFEGATVYVDLFPCNECAKLIIQAGIKKIVYLSDKYANTESTIASKRMFDAAGVEYSPLNPEYHETITLSLNPKDK